MGIYSKYLPSLVLFPKEIIPGDVVKINFTPNGLKFSQLQKDKHCVIVVDVEMKKDVWCLSGIVADSDDVSDALNQLLLEIAGTYLEFPRYMARKHGLKQTYIKKLSFFLSSVNSVKVFGRINFFENKRILNSDAGELEIIT